MVDISLKQQILDQLDRLDTDKQRQVLEYAQRLSTPQGVPGESLFRFIGLIPTDDLEKMAQAIEEDCENIDLDEWD